MNIWVFPKIGIPPNHPILIGFSLIKQPFWDTPIFGNTHFKSTVRSKLLLYFIFTVDTLRLPPLRESHRLPKPAPTNHAERVCRGWESWIHQDNFLSVLQLHLNPPDDMGGFFLVPPIFHVGSKKTLQRRETSSRSPRVFKTRGAISRELHEVVKANLVVVQKWTDVKNAWKKMNEDRMLRSGIN